MFVALSKVLDALFGPLTWAGLLVAGALLFRRRARLSAGLQVSALAVLYVFSMEPLANGLLHIVEAGATRTWKPNQIYDAVIVLGGGFDPDATAASGEVQFNAASERVLRGFELLRSGQARNVLLSAGSIDPRPQAEIEAYAVADQLVRWGIEKERIISEGKSRNTHENAVESARVVHERGWKSVLLITSAAHMKRALGCYRAVGLAPDTLPVDVRTYPPAQRRGSLLPRASALAQSTDALRELAGQLVYAVRGYSRP